MRGYKNPPRKNIYKIIFEKQKKYIWEFSEKLKSVDFVRFHRGGFYAKVCIKNIECEKYMKSIRNIVDKKYIKWGVIKNIEYKSVI
jgi:hypothetical protein